MKTITIKFTIKEARSLDLLICECGWPENNHFSPDIDGKRLCAHTDKCKGFNEVVRRGQKVSEEDLISIGSIWPL